MKKSLPILCILLIQQIVFSQNVGINSTGATPDASAILDVGSTTKGMLTPRMKTTQRTAIIAPAKGLVEKWK